MKTLSCATLSLVALLKLQQANAQTCTSYQWQCYNDRCIPSSYLCDGDNDCGDNSDETDCFTSTNIVGLAVGLSVAAFVLFVVIPTVICIISCCCIAGGIGAAASSRYPRTPTVMTTPAPVPATVITAGRPQTEYPPSYSDSYLIQTGVKQPPPAFVDRPTEMSVYPPLHQAAAAYPEESNVMQVLLPTVAAQHACAEKSSTIDPPPSQGPNPLQ